MSLPRRVGKTALYLGLAILLLGFVAYLTVQSDWAKDRGRQYITELISNQSGGRAEIESLNYDLLSLSGEVRGFVLHGKESANEPPFFRADRVYVDASILSWWDRDVQLESVSVLRPRINILLYEDGTNNLPEPPGPPSEDSPVAPLIELGIRQFEIQEGVLNVAQQSVPLNILGEGLDVSLGFQPAEDRYSGNLSADRLLFGTDSIDPVPFEFQAGIILERNRALIENGRLSYGESGAEFSIVAQDFRDLRIEVDFDSTIQVADFHGPFSLPVEPQGRLESDGTFTYHDGDWNLTGQTSGNDLALRTGAVRVSNLSLRSDLKLESDSFVFSNLTVNALGGTISGEASLTDESNFEMRSRLQGLSLERVSRASGIGEVGYNSILSGSLTVQTVIAGGGARNTVADADLNLSATEGTNPLEGTVRATYNQRNDSISFGDTSLTMANSQVNVSGSIGEGLSISARTSRIEDFFPALALFSETPETLIPVSFGPNGSAGFIGVAQGSWTQPRIEGSVRASNLVYEGRSLDSITALTTLSSEGLEVSNLVAQQGNLELRGDATMALSEWEPTESSRIQAHATLKAPNLKTALEEAGRADLPISGSPSLEVDVEGTVGEPVARLNGTLARGSAWGNAFDNLVVNARYAGNEAVIESARLTRGDARIDLSGRFRHQEDAYDQGSGQASVRLAGLTLSDIPELRDEGVDAEAALRGEYQVAFRLAGKEFAVQDLEGRLEVTNIEYADKRVGRLALDTRTQSGKALVALRGELAGSSITGDATIGLENGYPASGKIAVQELTLNSVRPWLPSDMSERNLPLEASLVSEATFEGSLTDPSSLTAELVIDRLRLATLAQPGLTLTSRNKFELSNPEPMRFRWTGKRFEATNVRLTGTGTELALSGNITPGSERQQLDLRARGSVNFSIIHAFEPSIDADGTSELDLTIRGTLRQPDAYGMLDLNDASFYLTGVPNGLDNINGRIFLYRDRANIEEITAQSGGGDLSLSGFVSYNEGIPTFRLSATGADIRVRYPPGVSTSANARLELTGSKNRSILSGNVDITRIALNPRSDLGSILQNASQPVATPSADQNEFLRNMRFDVTVQTATDVRFDSTLTEDLAGEADLRLRGNPYNIVLLGNVSITQGEINFFGNEYSIDRGEISFLNPVKLEPIINLDLRTRVRSIDVTLTFSGPLDKLSVNYRSDPPLQLNEIIALLTVGRAPAGSPALAEAQSEAAQSWQQIGASALVGQAVAAPIAGRLQKFFGVSRIKIDPRLTGVENNPQARLTVEQQVSRDITVTFITNLADAQQQVVRLEWNFNPAWSMVALRDEDGLFGVDFLYRKRF